MSEISHSWVRYAPEVETFDPQFDELLEEVVGFWEKKGRESPVAEGTGRAVRGAHAKTFGVLEATVELLDGLPAEYAQGIYRVAGQHDALIRFSITSGHLGPDAQLGHGIGFAMKMFGIDGPKLMDEEPDTPTFDLVLKNTPIFIANTARHYLFIEEVANDAPTYLSRGVLGLHQLLSDFLTGKGTLQQPDWAWDELLAFLRALVNPARHPLLSSFWSMGAMRHGEYIAKIRVAPAPENAEHVLQPDIDLGSGPDVFHEALARELRKQSYDFDLQVQLCADLHTMPVNELTVEWPEQLSPFVTVGSIHIPRQDVSGVDGDSVERTDALAFNQWRVTAEHAPLGEIMHVRKVYTTSARVRRVLNHQSQTEPASPAAALR
ncbi:MAG: catalase family protein [Chloroflexi bacterium]|nr:catalase family protein [Chloroflexota bacterium]